MLRKFMLGSLCVVVTGCASIVNSWTQDPVRVNGVKDTVATISLAADRRTVVVGIYGNNKGKFCAEPPPDVATDIVSTLKAAIEAKGGRAKPVDGQISVDDAFHTTTVVLAQRTALLDVYRTGTYALCQYHLNGALKDSELKDQFDALTKAVINAISQQAAQSNMQNESTTKPSKPAKPAADSSAPEHQ